MGEGGLNKNKMTTTPQLEGLLRETLEDAVVLASDESCAWVRSRIGIVGITRIDRKVSAADLEQQLAEKVTHAYGLLDRLKDQSLSFDDLWNLLLFVGVPWRHEEMSALLDVAKILSRYSRNVEGSRKIILWQNSTPTEYIGPLGQAQDSWMPEVDDPLRGAVHSIAIDDIEDRALQTLFKRRITDDDFNHLIQILGRKTHV